MEHVVTFGDKHQYPIAGTILLTNGSIGLLLENIPEGMSGREAAFKLFNGAFSFEYSKEEWDKQEHKGMTTLFPVDFQKQWDVLNEE